MKILGQIWMLLKYIKQMKKLSAGLLMFRTKNGYPEFFLVHPGGPFFKNKDDRYWSIPKGEPEDDEPDNLVVAQREFKEETSIEPKGPYVELGAITQKNGKVVHAWAFEGDWPDGKPIVSNTIELDWPRNSGKRIVIPEVDRGEWFNYENAKIKLNERQAELIDRLVAVLESKKTS